MYAEYNNGDRELYDLQNDPYELQSLHNRPAYASVRRRSRPASTSCKNCAGPSCRVYQPDPTP